MFRKILLFSLFLFSLNIIFSYTDPILYYTFDKEIGNTLTDSSVNNHDAFIEGSTKRIDESRILKGIEFDGINSTIRIPFASNVNINNSFTISTWILLNDTSNFLGIFSKSNLESGKGFVFGQTNGGGALVKNKFRLVYSFNKSKYNSLWSFPYGEWIYLTITYNGTHLKNYVNGELSLVKVGTIKQESIPILENSIFNMEDYIIGTGIIPNEFKTYFKGFLDEFRIYDYVLDDINIAELYAYSFYPDISDTENPTQPINLKVDERGKYSLTFSWDASTDDVGVVGYKLYRDGVFLENIYSTNYTDVNLSHTKNYTYSIVAYDPSGKESIPTLIKIQTLIKGELYFYDDFESGDLSKVNLDGFHWASGSRVKTDNPYNGNYSMKFLYKGTGNTLKHATSEQRFFLGDKYTNLWFKFYLYIPSNYYFRAPGILHISDVIGSFKIGETVYKDNGNSRDYATIMEVNETSIFIEGRYGNKNFLRPPFNITSDSGATATVDSLDGMTLGNKGLLLWNYDYSGISETSFHYSTHVDIRGSTCLAVGWKKNGSRSPIPMNGLCPGIIVINISKDVGKWHEFLYHVRVSEIGKNDGIFQLWKNGNLLLEKFDLDNWQDEPHNFLDKGYILGWKNGGFYENTTLYIDDFEVSTQPLTSSFVEDTQSPTTPTNLQTINITNTLIEFNWTKSEDNIAIFEYEIYKDSTLLGTTTNNYYTLSNLQSNTTYLIELKAIDSSNNPSNFSQTLIVKTLETLIVKNQTEPPTNKTEPSVVVVDDDKKKSSSGSGGGGTSTFSITNIENINLSEVCIPYYKYLEWSLCQEGKQTQFIEDLNNCQGDFIEERQCKIELTEEENLLLNAKKIDLEKIKSKKYKASLNEGYNEIFYVEEKLDDSIFLFEDESTGQEYYGQYYDSQGDKYYYTLKRVDEGIVTILQEEGIISNTLYDDVNDLKKNGLWYKLLIGFGIILFLGFLILFYFYIRKTKEIENTFRR